MIKVVVENSLKSSYHLLLAKYFDMKKKLVTVESKCMSIEEKNVPKMGNVHLHS